MGAKKKNLSPAKQREAIAQAARIAAVPVEKPQQWTKWEYKVAQLSGRDYEKIKAGWLAHIPEISPPGSPPNSTVGDIASIAEAMSRVGAAGSLSEPHSGARPAVLNEAFYLAHKAIHVAAICSAAIKRGNPTWSAVDAYQASLFALGSVMAFLGLVVDRDANDFMVVDVWTSVEAGSTKRYPTEEKYHFVRFKSLDHFHKWAILKRVLVTLKSKSKLANLLCASISELDDKAFSRHRNTVHYDSGGWLARDLLAEDTAGPVKQAKTAEEFFLAISEGTVCGSVYLMCALIELACEFAADLSGSQVLAEELRLLERRRQAMQTFIGFEWVSI